MDAVIEGTLRRQLADRRRKLERAVGQLGQADDLVHLLRTVDSALERMEAGTYGVCEVCSEPVQHGLLRAYPAIQYCLCELTPKQQRALEQDLDLASRVQWALLPQQDLESGGWEGTSCR